MDLVGWGMRVMVIGREYATQEITARLFGSWRVSCGCASRGVPRFEDSGLFCLTIDGGIGR
jgi:hypothetical protein